MKKPSKAIQRMFAIASFSGAALKTIETTDPYLNRLMNHINNAMKVYSRKVGNTEYWRYNKELELLWGNLSKEYSNIIQETSIPALITCFSYIVSPKDYKAFLGMIPPQYEDDVPQEDWIKICDSSLRLNKALNDLLNTTSITLVKPKEKITKIKKERTKSTKLNKHQKEVQAEQKRKARVKIALKERISQARKN